MMVDNDPPERPLRDLGGIRQPGQNGDVDGYEEVGSSVVARGGNHLIGTFHEPIDARNRRLVGQQEVDALRGKRQP